QVRHVEYQNTAGVVGGDVVVHICADGVLDLDTGDIELGAVVTHDHIAGLAHINAGVGGTDGHVAFHQRVFSLYRVNTVGAILGGWAVGPLHADIANDDVLAFVHLQRIADGVLDGQILE